MPVCYKLANLVSDGKLLVSAHKLLVTSCKLLVHGCKLAITICKLSVRTCKSLVSIQKLSINGQEMLVTITNNLGVQVGTNRTCGKIGCIHYFQLTFGNTVARVTFCTTSNGHITTYGVYYVYSSVERQLA